MKKLLLLAAATAALSTSAFADEGMADISKTGFYVRVDGGADFFTKSSYSDLKLKPKAAATVHVGLGSYLGNDIRGELTYSHHFSQKITASSKIKDTTTDVGSKSDIHALMAKGYFDFYDAGVAQFYIGGGLGVSRIHEVTYKNQTTITTVKGSSIVAGGQVIINGVVQTPAMLQALNGDTKAINKTQARSKKTSYVFAYSLAVGTAIKAADSVTIDVQYNYSDFGKAKVTKHRGHTALMGLRFDI